MCANQRENEKFPSLLSDWKGRGKKCIIGSWPVWPLSHFFLFGYFLRSVPQWQSKAISGGWSNTFTSYSISSVSPNLWWGIATLQVENCVSGATLALACLQRPWLILSDSFSPLDRTRDVITKQGIWKTSSCHLDFRSAPPPLKHLLSKPMPNEH